MSKKSTKWIYSYQNTCGPCRRITPIVDTIIATGLPVDKVEFSEVPDLVKRYGTPAIVKWNDNTNLVEEVYAGDFWSSYMGLSERYSWLLSTDMTPIEFLVKTLKNENPEKEIKSLTNNE